MSSQTTAMPFDSGALPNLPMQVKNKTLLGIMAIPVIFALLAILDKPVFGGAILANMITNPRDIAFWTAVLTVPHIVASLLTFVDREYIVHHKSRLMKGSVIALLLGFGVPFATGWFLSAILGYEVHNWIEYGSTLGSMGTLVVMAFYTMYHNLQQQYGIALMMARQSPTFDYQIWRWFTILPAGLGYTVLMTSEIPEINQNMDLAILVIGLSLGIATIFGIRFIKTIRANPNHTKIGLIYFLSNMLLLYVCFGLIVSGYGFMATLVPRLTHDFTAFWVYMVHDENRNATKVHNPIYALPKMMGMHPWLLCAPIAIAVSAALMNVANNLFMVSLFVTSLNFMHYYMEGYMWKRGTPHRQHVPFV